MRVHVKSFVSIVNGRIQIDLSNSAAAVATAHNTDNTDNTDKTHSQPASHSPTTTTSYFLSEQNALVDVNVRAVMRQQRVVRRADAVAVETPSNILAFIMF